MLKQNILINFSRIIQQLQPGAKRQLLAPHQMKISLVGGLPYEAFDPSALVKPWHLLNLVERSRGDAFNPHPEDTAGSFLDFASLLADTYHFHFITQLNIHRLLYDFSIPKAPLDLFITLQNVGKSSMTILTEVKHPSLEETLVSNRLMSVCVSAETRKSVSLPANWVSKYKHLAVGEALTFDEIKYPDSWDKILRYPITVQAGDIDDYLHANWSTYLKYCHQAQVGAQFQQGQKVVSHLLRNLVKSASLVYFREGNLKDTINVEFWEGKEGTAHFNFVKDNQSICQANIDYYKLS